MLFGRRLLKDVCCCERIVDWMIWVGLKSDKFIFEGFLKLIIKGCCFFFLILKGFEIFFLYCLCMLFVNLKNRLYLIMIC